MPELAEVARAVHHLKVALANRRIATVLTQDDSIVYGKVGTSADAFAAALTGKTVLDARRQGKYFWLVMDSPPHPLFHFGMSGWMRFKGTEGAGASYRVGGRGDKKRKAEEDDEDEASASAAAEAEPQEWPPKYMKFVLQVEGKPHIEAAFVDPRRLGRIRLIDAPAEMMRQTTPLKENGPDPVLDVDVLTLEWLSQKLQSKRIPVKAFLLDQAVISGVGNWVGDEVLFHARIHPEQYTNTLSEEQAKKLHGSLYYVCKTACDALADSDLYPSDWLMKYRWDKGKKEKNTLPNGDKIDHLTVGGRTSAFVPNRQKKTGAVKADVDESESKGDEKKGDDKKAASKAKGADPSRARKKQKAAPADDTVASKQADTPKAIAKATAKAKAEQKQEPKPHRNWIIPRVAGKGRPRAAEKDTTKTPGDADDPSAADGRRRSGRVARLKR